MYFCPARCSKGHEKETLLNGPSAFNLQKWLSWLLGQAQAPRILWACQASHHRNNVAAVSSAKFNVVFLFSFHSQRTGSKTKTFLACYSQLFLSKSLEESMGRRFCSVWEKSCAEEYKRFHFLFNLY